MLANKFLFNSQKSRNTNFLKSIISDSIHEFFGSTHWHLEKPTQGKYLRIYRRGRSNHIQSPQQVTYSRQNYISKCIFLLCNSSLLFFHRSTLSKQCIDYHIKEDIPSMICFLHTVCQFL